MRYLILLAALLASGATAQIPIPFDAVTLSVGPSSGFEGSAGIAEIRGRIPVASVVSIEPSFGVGLEGAYDYTSCGIIDCFEGRTSPRLGYSAGAALTARAPEAWLPGPLADAHVGIIGQLHVGQYYDERVRYGFEVGAATHLSSSLTLGVDVQAVRYSDWDPIRTFERQGGTDVRSSIAPVVRLGYALGR
ncbi:hypothetical protein [Rubricoccus marinus]|uniref:Outer membrane protein beta-barrel domain-containing protein n=1 Tax=Rubricoccus marinus TaxID=716817 RepID=A0A259U112_9BACT|nr:hypothetical protein [Rubricoccus marinus]OZC03630.1 hypothetical protein BSZ36_11935 [Rubricoccus marinus]